MKYLVVTDTGQDVYFDGFDALIEANEHAWYTYDRYQKLPRHCSEREYHIFVATPAEFDDLDMEDNYFDSETFYLPKVESSYMKLSYKVHGSINEHDNLDFFVDNGKLSFTVPWNLIKDHYIEEIDSFDEVGTEIIFDYYEGAVQEKREEILAFYEMA